MDDHINLEEKEKSIPGTSKRPTVFHHGDIIKRRKVEHWLKSTEKLDCTPIESLVCTEFCPLISGTLTSVSEWRTSSQGTRYSNFVLKDTSGQIVGVIFRSHGSNFEKQFVTGATMTVKNAVVKPVKENYREKSTSKYELSIPNTLRTVAVEPPRVENYAQPAKRQIDPSVRIPIRDVVEKIDPRELVHVIGVITEVENVKSKHGDRQNTITRDFRIIDESEMEVAVTIWNERATRFESPVGTVVAVYDVAVRLQTELKIKSLTFQKNSRMLLDPPGHDAERLKIWYSEWKFRQGSQSLKKYAASVAVSSTGEQNCNPCVADTPTEKPDTIKTISTDKIPSAMECFTAQFETPISNSPTVQAESEAEICTSAYHVTINDFSDLSSIESDDESTIVDSSSNTSSVEDDDDRPFPAQFIAPAKNNFTKISEINDGRAVGFVDVLAVISHQCDPQIVPWTDDITAKWMVKLIDETRQSIWMVVRGWNEMCTEEYKNLIIAAKRVKVRCRKNCKQLICTDKFSTLIVEPEIDEAKELRKCFPPEGTDHPIAPVALIGDLRDGQIASIVGVLTRINEAKVIKAEYLHDVARTVYIFDSSEKMIRLALWGDLAQDFAISRGSIVFVANVKIYRSNQINGALTPASRVTIDPNEFEEDFKRPGTLATFTSYPRVASKRLKIQEDYCPRSRPMSEDENHEQK